MSSVAIIVDLSVMCVDASGGDVEYLRRVYEDVRKRILDLIGPGNVCSIAVFGSAARPQDFVRGVSDVDVLVLTREEPKTRMHTFVACGSRVDVIVMAVDRFRVLVDRGDPLAFMLKHRVVLYDGGCADALNCRPRVTEHTKRVLRRSVFAALGLSLESYYMEGDGVRALSHLYHSVRHLIRYKASLRGSLPISDREVYESAGPPLKDLYAELVRLRKKRDARRIRELTSRAVELICAELGIRRPNLGLLDEAKGDVGLVMVWEDRGQMVVRVEIWEGCERRVVEIRDCEVRSVDSVLPEEG